MAFGFPDTRQEPSVKGADFAASPAGQTQFTPPPSMGDGASRPPDEPTTPFQLELAPNSSIRGKEALMENKFDVAKFDIDKSLIEFENSVQYKTILARIDQENKRYDNLMSKLEEYQAKLNNPQPALPDPRMNENELLAAGAAWAFGAPMTSAIDAGNQIATQREAMRYETEMRGYQQQQGLAQAGYETTAGLANQSLKNMSEYDKAMWAAQNDWVQNAINAHRANTTGELGFGNLALNTWKAQATQNFATWNAQQLHSIARDRLKILDAGLQNDVSRYLLQASLQMFEAYTSQDQFKIRTSMEGAKMLIDLAQAKGNVAERKSKAKTGKAAAEAELATITKRIAELTADIAKYDRDANDESKSSKDKQNATASANKLRDELSKATARKAVLDGQIAGFNSEIDLPESNELLQSLETQVKQYLMGGGGQPGGNVPFQPGMGGSYLEPNQGQWGGKGAIGGQSMVTPPAGAPPTPAAQPGQATKYDQLDHAGKLAYQADHARDLILAMQSKGVIKDGKIVNVAEFNATVRMFNQFYKWNNAPGKPGAWETAVKAISGGK